LLISKISPFGRALGLVFSFISRLLNDEFERLRI
jgi:hypothetical protein